MGWERKRKGTCPAGELKKFTKKVNFDLRGDAVVLLLAWGTVGLSLVPKGAQKVLHYRLDIMMAVRPVCPGRRGAARLLLREESCRR